MLFRVELDNWEGELQADVQFLQLVPVLGETRARGHVYLPAFCRLWWLDFLSLMFYYQMKFFCWEDVL